jgi:hypothetical protein
MMASRTPLTPSPARSGASILLLLPALLVVVVRAADSPAQSPQRPPFRDAAMQAGLTFVHDNGARGRLHLPEIMGSGAALFDYDGDGDLDVYLVQGGALETGPGPGAGAQGGSPAKCRLFRNELSKDSSGNRLLRFTDVTDTAGVGFSGAGMGAATGDYDNDGDLDLYVTSYGPNVLFRNDGNGTFTDVTGAAGVNDARWSTSAAFLDYDRDGDLDLFVANYVDFTVKTAKACTDPVGAPDYCAPSAYRPVPAKLFRNEGNGTFSDATEAAGIARAYGAGLGVAVGDYNGDGWLDLYVANDATPNQLWINTGRGTFEDEGWLSGSAVNAAGRPEGSMGIASGDYDADGDEDLFVTNLTRETFVLYVNDANGMFEDKRAAAGVSQTTAPMTGFGAAWLDYDRDGLLDLIAANGAVNVAPGQRNSSAPYAQRNQLFHNTGSGRLVDVTDAGGPAFENALVGRGLATGDLDNDGDVDVLISSNGGPVRLLLNDSAPAHWLTVRLDTASGNRLGFGARVGVVRQKRPTLWRRVGTDGSYLSAADCRPHFGLGSEARIDRVVVEWPDGLREYWAAPSSDQELTLRRGTGTAEPGQ